jgi:hypothetical protein
MTKCTPCKLRTLTGLLHQREISRRPLSLSSAHVGPTSAMLCRVTPVHGSHSWKKRCPLKTYAICTARKSVRNSLMSHLDPHFESRTQYMCNRWTSHADHSVDTKPAEQITPEANRDWFDPGRAERRPTHHSHMVYAGMRKCHRRTFSRVKLKFRGNAHDATRMRWKFKAMLMMQHARGGTVALACKRNEGVNFKDGPHIERVSSSREHQQKLLAQASPFPNLAMYTLAECQCQDQQSVRQVLTQQHEPSHPALRNRIATTSWATAGGQPSFHTDRHTSNDIIKRRDGMQRSAINSFLPLLHSTQVLR